MTLSVKWLCIIATIVACSQTADKDIIYALKKNHAEIVREMIRDGHPVDGRKNGHTLLMIAATGGKTDVEVRFQTVSSGRTATVCQPRPG